MKDTMNTYGKTQTFKSISESIIESEEEKEIIKLDLSVLDNAFDKFYKTEESLSGYLNIKVIKSKFADFKKKLEVWKKNASRR